MDGIFKILCLHGKYPFGFLHPVKIIYMGLEFYNAMVKNIFYFIFPNAMQMQKNKYAKVKINLCKVKSKYK